MIQMVAESDHHIVSIIVVKPMGADKLAPRLNARFVASGNESCSRRCGSAVVEHPCTHGMSNPHHMT